jgi:hypothetical protein
VDKDPWYKFPWNGGIVEYWNDGEWKLNLNPIFHNSIIPGLGKAQ